ncbi:hypothetical protein, partial [Methylosinus sporium]|uniref:hypothetical protein n=1 Tax=Methylosinus sporium TaxID=428 RepID=UPI001AEDDFB6
QRWNQPGSAPRRLRQPNSNQSRDGTAFLRDSRIHALVIADARGESVENRQILLGELVSHHSPEEKDIFVLVVPFAATASDSVRVDSRRCNSASSALVVAESAAGGGGKMSKACDCCGDTKTGSRANADEPMSAVKAAARRTSFFTREFLNFYQIRRRC